MARSVSSISSGTPATGRRAQRPVGGGLMTRTPVRGSCSPFGERGQLALRAPPQTGREAHRSDPLQQPSTQPPSRLSPFANPQHIAASHVDHDRFAPFSKPLAHHRRIHTELPSRAAPATSQCASTPAGASDTEPARSHVAPGRPDPSPAQTLASRAKRGGRRVGPEARPDLEAGPIMRAIGLVATRS